MPRSFDEPVSCVSGSGQTGRTMTARKKSLVFLGVDFWLQALKLCIESNSRLGFEVFFLSVYHWELKWFATNRAEGLVYPAIGMT